MRNKIFQKEIWVNQFFLIFSFVYSQFFVIETMIITKRHFLFLINVFGSKHVSHLRGSVEKRPLFDKQAKYCTIPTPVGTCTYNMYAQPQHFHFVSCTYIIDKLDPDSQC